MRQRRLRLCLLPGLLLELLNACRQDNGGEADSDGDGTSTRGNIRLVATFPEPVRMGAAATTSTTRATPPTITHLLLQTLKTTCRVSLCLVAQIFGPVQTSPMI